MSDEKVSDVIVIGGGPVGLFGTYYAGFRSLNVTLIEATEDLGGQITFLYPDKMIYDMPGFYEVTGKEVVKNLVRQALKYNPTVRLGEKVLNISRKSDNQFEVITDKGRYLSKAILVTTGIGTFSPNKVDAEGLTQFEGKGVFYYVRDPERFRGKDLLIVGGGDSAVDWALNLKDIARSITLIHRRDVFRAHEKSVEALTHSDIKVKLFCILKSVSGNGWVERAVVTNTQTDTDEELTVNDVLVLVGYKADLSIMKQWGIQMDNRGLLVDETLETSVPGIFAAGDVAAPRSGFRQNLLAVGFGQAATAANRIKKILEPSAPSFEHSTLSEPASKPEATTPQAAAVQQ
jgi:thioredoxin reductase